MTSQQAQRVVVGDTLLYQGALRRVVAIEAPGTVVPLFTLEGLPHRLLTHREVELPATTPCSSMKRG